MTLVVYIAYTVLITNWRLKHRRAMNEADAAAKARAVDSLLNYETVKYFNNEQYEADRLKDDLKRAEDASVQSEISLAWLNAGQAFIIAVGVTAMMALAARGVADKTMTLGDLVLVNAYLIQLFIPLNFLGTVYREIRNALTDMEKLFGLLHQPPEITDAADAKPLQASRGEVRFEQVGFAYDVAPPDSCGMSASPFRPATNWRWWAPAAPANRRCRVCCSASTTSPADASWSTARTSARSPRPACAPSIGIVPQDTVLFNDTLYHNIAYGRPDASREEVLEAARAASLDRFIATLPDGYEPWSANAA
jgi:ATP-binding cassette, subfamily B, heavy metal transporter